jgi:endonuclease-3 related protein
VEREVKIYNLYQKLKEKHGEADSQWQLWCKRNKTEREKEEVIIGAILTQRTNWRNVELTITNLKKAGMKSLTDLLSLLRTKKNIYLLRPCGFYHQKAERLKNLIKFILKRYRSLKKMVSQPTEKLRRELLSLKGIGPETADSILLYALNKPIFVIDEYTRRLVKEWGLAENFSYDYLQKLFENNLPKDYKLYQDFHALIVIDGKKRKK